MGKRGPKPGSRPRVTDRLDIDAVCNHVSDGKTLTEIKGIYNISIATLLAWIDETPERSARVRAARQATAKYWDEVATKGIQDASDSFELAKAKELAHHYRWRASKIAPREYGERLELAGEVGVKTMTDEQLDAKLAAFKDKLSGSK